METHSLFACFRGASKWNCFNARTMPGQRAKMLSGHFLAEAVHTIRLETKQCQCTRDNVRNTADYCGPAAVSALVRASSARRRAFLSSSDILVISIVILVSVLAVDLHNIILLHNNRRRYLLRQQT